LLVNRYTNRYIFINHQKFTKINFYENIFSVEGTEYKSLSNCEMQKVEVPWMASGSEGEILRVSVNN